MKSKAKSPAQRSILVTGAASGIGEACARLLLEQGCNVAALDRDAISPHLAEIAAPGQLLALKADVASETSCAQAVAAAVEEFGRIDALIHMAAVHSTKTWRDANAAEFNRTLEINVTGSFLMASAVARAMEQTGGGAIVLAMSGSIQASGLGGDGRGGPAYVTSKAAIIGLTRALARSFAPLNIRVNAVSPGSTATSMTADYSPEALAGVAARTLVGRIGKPEEIAEVAIFLASDAARYVDGEIVAVNGGGSLGL
ncbi:MAG: SDR family NAD(P)-dependent oxidoreductase [Beijerinckiaceae bacterium]